MRITVNQQSNNTQTDQGIRVSQNGPPIVVFVSERIARHYVWRVNLADNLEKNTLI